MMKKLPQPDREQRRITDARRDEAYFRARDRERLAGEQKAARLRELRLAKKVGNSEQVAGEDATTSVSQPGKKDARLTQGTD